MPPLNVSVPVQKDLVPAGCIKADLLCVAECPTCFVGCRNIQELAPHLLCECCPKCCSLV